MKKITNIAKNTSYFTFALILQKIISFTYFAILARSLGPEDLGKYYFALSFTTIFAIFIDFGLANTQTREVARSQAKAQKITSLILAIKIPMLFIVLGSATVLINILGYSELTRQLVYLASISMVLDSLTLTFFSTIRGFHNLIFESVFSVLFQLSVFSIGLSFLKLGYGISYLMAAMAAASVIMCLGSGLVLWKKFKIKLIPLYDYSSLKALILMTIPFSLYAIFQKIYTYLDTVLLSVLAGDTYVGLYQIAFKIVFAIQFLPLAFVASLYPAFSSYWKNNKQQLATSFERAMSYLIIISLPVAIGIVSIADRLILIFKDDFNDSILPLQIIMASLLFIFLNYPIGSLLNACQKQKINTRFMGITLVLSVLLNIVLIPKFNVIGASITVVITNCLMFILGMSVVPKIISLNSKKLVMIFMKSLLSATLMGAFVVFAKYKINIFMVIIISAIIYSTILFLLKGFSKSDILSVVESFKKT